MIFDFLFYFIFIVLIIVAAVLYRTAGPPNVVQIARKPSKFRKKDRSLPELLPVENKIALVTGAGGFLALNIVEELLKQNWKVYGLVRKSTDISVLKEIQNKHKSELTIVFADLGDFEALQKAIPDNVQVIFHVAACVGMWFGKAQQMYDVNVLGTRNIVDIALSKNIPKIIHTSSVSVFQGPGKPKDTADVETLPLYGIGSYNAYAYTKAVAESEIRGGIEDGQWACIMNPGAIIGKYDRTGFARMGKMLVNNTLPMVPPASNSFSHVTQVAKAHVKAAERGRLGRNYLLGGVTQSYQQVAAWTGEVLGIDGHRRIAPLFVLSALGLFNDFVSLFTGREPDLTLEIARSSNGRCECNSQRAVDELDYVADIDLKQALTESMKWLMETNRLDLKKAAVGNSKKAQ